MKLFLKYIFCVLFITGFSVLNLSRAQVTVGSITPILIGSTGNFSIAGGMMLSASTGEPMVPTSINGGYILTQGFQQPSSNNILSLSANVIYTNASCSGSNDGVATVTPNGGAAPYFYSWSSSPNDSLPIIDSLDPGTYTVTVTDAGGLTTQQIFVIQDGSGICGLNVYSGLTPNGDAHNDTWIIDHIDAFPNNRVSIYNRWGILVWTHENYDNQSVVWTGLDQQENALSDGTYYYVIQIGDLHMNNWVELSH